MDAVVAGIAAVAPTIAALAAWHNAKAAKNQTNGMLHNKLDRMETKLDDLSDWQADHISRWHK